MSFFDTLNQMLVILFAVALGYVAHRLGYLGGEINQKLSKIVIHIGIPALTLAAVMNNSDGPGLDEIRGVLLAVAAFYILSLACALVLAPIIGGEKLHRGVWRFSMTFSNAAFVGYPVVEGLFGQEGLFYAVIIVLPMTLLNFTIAPLMLVGTLRFDWRKMVTPGSVCAVLALAMTFTGWRPPAMVGEMMDMVGDITIPLSLLVLGSMLASMPARSIFGSWRLWTISGFRLLILPAVMSLILHQLSADALIAGVAVAQMSMPVSVNGSMMCLDADGDVETMARSIFLTTVLSMVSIPICSVLFMQF